MAPTHSLGLITGQRFDCIRQFICGKWPLQRSSIHREAGDNPPSHRAGHRERPGLGRDLAAAFPEVEGSLENSDKIGWPVGGIIISIVIRGNSPN